MKIPKQYQIPVAAGVAFALVFTAFGWPLYMIFRNINYGEHVQNEFVLRLSERFPTLTVTKGGVGYTGPSITFQISNVDNQGKQDIIDFVEQELSRRNIVVDVYVRFSDEDHSHAYRKSTEPKKGWFEHP